MRYAVIILWLMVLTGKTAILAADGTSSPVTTRRANPMQMVMEGEKPLPAFAMRLFGGFVIQPGTLKGHVAFFNGQARVPSDVFDPVLKNTYMLMHIAAKEYPQVRRITPAYAAEAMEDVGCQAAVFLVDDTELPTLLVSPEEKWALVNVAALARDKPDPARLRQRTLKEIWRGFAHACGAGASASEHCVMNPCYSLAGLDAMDSDMISMEPFMAMRECFPKMGISPFRRVKYVQACKEGWAPAPTNDAQRVIMEKVKDGTIDDLKAELLKSQQLKRKKK